MNPLAWILDSLKTHPEPAQLPDLTEATPLELAEARSRLATFAQVATELRRLVDQELAAKIPTALRYGDDVYRPANGRGSAKIAATDEAEFWVVVVEGLKASPRPTDLIAALFPSSALRITAIPKLAAALGVEDAAIKSFLEYSAPSSPLSVMPRSKAPKYLQDMEEGDIR